MTQPARKRALLIGIDDYQGKKNLDGCKNDIEAMKKILVERFGFPDDRDHITVLLNEQATNPNITKAWEDLIEATGEGDIVVTHYAGHGSQLPDLENDQPDGFDETIVTHESHHKCEECSKNAKHDCKKKNTDITNDQINDWLVGLSQKKPGNITVIFDCCHSGTMTRGEAPAEEGGKARHVRGDRRTPSAMGRRPFTPKYAKQSTGQEYGASHWLPLSEDYVVIAGCRDEELSWEKVIKRGGKKYAHGSLTYYLTEELKKAGSGSTYRDIFEPTRARVTAHNNTQHPQIEGNPDKAVFGVETIETMRYVEVSSVDGETVELDGGSIHGVSVGSKWAIYPKGTKVTERATKLGLVEITSAEPATATARVVEGTVEESSPIVRNGRAVLEEYSFGDLVLTYRIIVDPNLEDIDEQLSGLKEALDDEGLVREAKDDELPDARIYLIGKRKTADPAKDPVPQLGGLAEPTWAVVTEDGELMMPPKGLDEWQWVHKKKKGSIATNLRILARLRHAMELDNPDPDNPLRGIARLHLWRRDAKGDWERAHAEEDGRYVFKSAYRDADGKVQDKDYIGFSVELDEKKWEDLKLGKKYKLGKKDKEGLYVNLIALDPAGIIDVVYPPAEAHEKLTPGEFKIRMDTRPGEKPMFFGLPDNYPFYRDPLASGPVEGPQTFKLFISTVPLNLRFIAQTEAVRGGGGEAVPESGLQTLVEGALGNRAGFEDDEEEATVVADEQGWVTVTQAVTLRRAAAADTATLDGGQASLGQIKLSAPNIVGSAAVEPPKANGRPAIPEAQSDTLTKALWASGLNRRAAIRIDGKSGEASRGADDEPASVRVPDPGPDMGQALLTTDDSGLLRWHFEPERTATRGDDERGERTYQLDDLDIGIEDPSQPTSRGVPSILVKKVVEVMVFPLLDPIGKKVTEQFAGWFETNHRPYRVRSFTQDDFGTLQAAEIDEAVWKRLSDGPSLLMLHGPFSRTHGSFGTMPPDYVKDLHDKYEGRIFAFDHFTMSHDPGENAKELLQRVPEGVSLDNVDILCHSRGGLLARVLAEQQGDTPKLGIRRVVFVGSPNAGTELASPEHMSEFVNHYTNMFGMVGKVVSVVDPSGIVDGMESVLTAVKKLAVGAQKGLKGITSMAPDSDFMNSLNSDSSVTRDGYFALASNFDPEKAGAVQGLMGKLAGRVLGGSDNDLIVPSKSVIDRRTADNGPPAGGERRKQNGDSRWFSIDAQFVFEPGASDEAVAHDGYFASKAGREKIINDWLRD